MYVCVYVVNDLEGYTEILLVKTVNTIAAIIIHTHMYYSVVNK